MKFYVSIDHVHILEEKIENQTKELGRLAKKNVRLTKEKNLRANAADNEKVKPDYYILKQLEKRAKNQKEQIKNLSKIHKSNAELQKENEILKHNNELLNIINNELQEEKENQKLNQNCLVKELKQYLNEIIEGKK